LGVEFHLNYCLLPQKEVTTEFDAILKDFETNPNVRSAVLISAKPGCFVAGADITMLEQCQTVEEARKISHEAQIMFNRMEKSSKPIASVNPSSKSPTNRKSPTGRSYQRRLPWRWLGTRPRLSLPHRHERQEDRFRPARRFVQSSILSRSTFVISYLIT
jgi:hypothetical protein